jgi:putative transposase
MLTHKTECFPTIEQKQLIETYFGMRRFFFNKTISTLKHKYGDLKENKKLITKKEIMEYRKIIFRTEYAELTKLAPSHILDTTMEDVLTALNSLWKKGRSINLRKKKNNNTCRFQSSSPTGSFRYETGAKYIRLPRLEYLKLAENLRWELFDNKCIKTITIKKQANRYFVSITCDVSDRVKRPNENCHLGIDWGLKTYITCYNGEEIMASDFDNNKLLSLDKKVAKKQKELDKKNRFSNNWFKAKTKLEQVYLNFVNYRLDFIKKEVYDIDRYYDSVTIEDLGMTFVTCNRRLANAARHKPYYLLKMTLINKFSQTGKPVYLVPKNYPSTQTCNACGNVKKGDDKLKLGESIYHCNICGHEDDRDANAAKNLWSHRNLELAVLED